MALVLVLAAAGVHGGVGAVAHVVHDLRCREEALADRNAAQALADAVGWPFLQREVRVVGEVPGLEGERLKSGHGARNQNREAAARRARYAALAEMARERNAQYVAVAHHAEDQLETILMSLLRGAATGVRGMSARRPLSSSSPLLPKLWLIRPMLCEPAIDRATTQRICQLAGLRWQEDATNADTSRLRSALRHRIVPELQSIRPAVLGRALIAAERAGELDCLLHRRARILARRARIESAPGAHTLSRATLRNSTGAEISAVLVHCLSQGSTLEPGVPRQFSARVLRPIVRAIQDDSTDPRVFTVGVWRVHVLAKQVQCASEQQ